MTIEYNHIPHFNVKATDLFLSANFPEIDTEISRIKTHIGEPRSDEQCAVMISYFKDHKIRMDLAQSQTILINILLSMDACRNIEGLFDASKENENFQHAFENYLRANLAA